ncbi:MAG TPA: HsdR family type I site-specific deoxyribonuclease [Bellilinea sp.]|nr:HsdR family type I site-specific deoxyribonuclease [Bellilinea sp.]
MTPVGEIERRTQDRVIDFFRGTLCYEYLGNWQDRPDNSNVEPDLLRTWLGNRGYDDRMIGKVLRELDQARTIVGGRRNLYDANEAVYNLLRYGVKVQPDIGAQYETVWLIDWENPESNHFAIAEEVTIKGEHTKRPDIVLYVNGIALGVLELKRSRVAVSEGIRQNLDNQQNLFIRDFFATVQLVLAGNETEGLRYGVIETPEKYTMTWKEPSAISNPLHQGLEQLCRKERLLELVHDFMVFDAGTKKFCRHNQYFGVRAAQEYVRRREGGIIWHTQGSGKSLTMVWLAKWIREHVEGGRVLLITDRVELDGQIEKVFKGVSEQIYRTRSGADLLNVLNASQEWLIGSLVHKFGAAQEGDVDEYVAEILRNRPRDFAPKGQIFVFVDECHRTQSGKLHRAMKALLPDAVLIGFTGTPLLKTDKQKSIEIFGPYIHTYKYDEAVADGVVLDLRYEARDIDQQITSQARIDQWFDAKTRGLNDYAKAQLKQRWGTLRKVLSSLDRLEKIVADILMDMETRPRLMDGHGNAMLVSDSIYNACRFYEMFERTDLAGKCAIVTSYQPHVANIKGETTGEGETEELLKFGVYRRMLAEYFNEPEETAVNKIEKFEEEIKERFIKHPGQMKLLIVVDKLLTGFDAPPATYLYIDKPMRDHGLFQAICRVNRLHTDDKEYGYIIDYRDLFKALEKSMKDYTGEAFDGFDAEDVAGLLKDRLEEGRDRLEKAREAVAALCEPVEPPRETADYLRYFCAQNSGDTEELKANEPRRVKLYKLVGSLMRAYANLANEMADAGYTDAETQAIKAEVEHYVSVRDEVKLASGDYIDLKMYEPAMRHLMDNYIRAEDSETLSSFDDLSLVDLLVNRGAEALDDLPSGIRNSQEAMAETIENNVRRVIVDMMAVNPAHYQKMSELLDALIQARKQQAQDYKDYLDQITALARQVKNPGEDAHYPETINSDARRALYDNLDRDESLAVEIDQAIRAVKKDGWRGNRFKEREVRYAIASVLRDHPDLIDEIFEIAKNQRDY